MQNPLFLTAALLGIAAAGTVSAQEAKNPFDGQPEAIEAGRARFLETCSTCHGTDGGGAGQGPSLIDGLAVRRASDERLFESVRNGVPNSAMPPVAFSDEVTWQLAAFVRSLSAPAIDARVPGDPEAGNALFFGKAGCSNCHRLRGQGGVLGPDLTDVGASRRLDQIREALLDPGKRIADGYTAVTVTLENGEKLRAVARNFNNYSAQVFDAKGKLHLLRGDGLKRLTFEEKSWMPGDYATRLSEAEIQNMLAFLSRQAVREERRGGVSE
jgi:putative heme-binding domain-containing protein